MQKNPNSSQTFLQVCLKRNMKLLRICSTFPFLNVWIMHEGMTCFQNPSLLVSYLHGFRLCWSRSKEKAKTIQYRRLKNVARWDLTTSRHDDTARSVHTLIWDRHGHLKTLEGLFYSPKSAAVTGFQLGHLPGARLSQKEQNVIQPPALRQQTDTIKHPQQDNTRICPLIAWPTDKSIHIGANPNNSCGKHTCSGKSHATSAKCTNTWLSCGTSAHTHTSTLGRCAEERSQVPNSSPGETIMIGTHW